MGRFFSRRAAFCADAQKPRGQRNRFDGQEFCRSWGASSNRPGFLIWFDLLKGAQYLEAANAADKVQIPQDIAVKHSDEFSYAYYRRAFCLGAQPGGWAMILEHVKSAISV